MINGDPSVMSYIMILEELSFEKFSELNKSWLQNINFQWLIEGHLDENQARNIIDSGKQSI